MRNQHPREKVVEKSLANRLRAVGIKVTKNHGSAYSGAGRLDLECERNGRCVHVEVKRSAREVPTPAQRIEARDLMRAGMTVLLCGGMLDVERVFGLVRKELLSGERVDSDVDSFRERRERSAST